MCSCKSVMESKRRYCQQAAIQSMLLYWYKTAVFDSVTISIALHVSENNSHFLLTYVQERVLSC